MSRTPEPRVILAVPGADAATVAQLEGEGLIVVSVAQTALALKRAVAALHPAVVLLHTELPNANAALVEGFARAGVATILLVDRALRRETNLLAGPLPYPPYILAQMERLGCVLVGAWPHVEGELGLLAEQAAEMGRTLAQSTITSAPRAGASGGIMALSGAVGGSGKSQIACNIAALLGILAERRVVLVDLDLIGASLHDMLGLEVPSGQGLEALHAATAPLVQMAVRQAVGALSHPEQGPDDPLVRAVAQDAVAGFDLAPLPWSVPRGRTGRETGRRADRRQESGRRRACGRRHDHPVCAAPFAP